VIPDPNISINDISKKFISISFNIAKELNITSISEVRKSFFHMSQKIFNLQKLKMKLYKSIKRRGSYHNLDEFEELIEKYNRMCKNYLSYV
jgi:hypothetical protein